MRQFKDLQQARKEIKTKYIKDNYPKDKSGYGDTSAVIADFIRVVVEGSLEDVNDLIKDIRVKGVWGANRANMYSRESHYYYSRRLLRTDENTERAFFLVGDKKMHLLEIAEKLTKADFVSILNFDFEIQFFVSELIYEYAVHTRDISLARMVINRMIETGGYSSTNKIGLVIDSNNMMDYWPLLTSPAIMKLINKSENKTTMENYINAVSKKNEDFPVDHSINEEIISRIGKSLKTAKTTIYSDKDTIMADQFDLIESNPVVRETMLSLKDWNLVREFRKLKERDEARLQDTIITYLNTEHRNGIKRSKFLRTYSRLKEEITIDVFRLNPKLQSFVLLEEIS